MSYQVVVTARARADAIETFRWIAEESPEAAARWESMSVTQRRAVLETLRIEVVLLPREKRGPGFEPETVQVNWR